jgi:hypothetical protein
MENQINNIIELAANLIIEGKATNENTIEMAIREDNDRCLKVFEDVTYMIKGYVNDFEKSQKGYSILLNSVYKILSEQ